MNTFNDYSRTVVREISYDQFEVHCSKSAKAASTFFAITGIAMVVIAGIALSYVTSGTAAYFVASGNIALGLFLLSGSILSHYNLNRDLQKLPLPNVKTADEYRALLDLNEGNRYDYHIPDLLKSQPSIESKQNARDFNGGNIYLFNGKPYELGEDFKKEIEKITEDEGLTIQIVKLAKEKCDPCHFNLALKNLNLEEKKTSAISKVYFECRASAIQKNVHKSLIPYVNQSIFSDIMGILKGRYWNKDLGIELSQRSYDKENPSASMSIDVVQEGSKWYIYLRQLFQITEVVEDRINPIGYFTAELKIDPFPLSGPGYLTWHSPQKARQTFY